jgi:RNA polymerase sigma-70 factor (ECF subfamily)
MGFDQDVQRALHNLAETPRTCLLLKTVVELDYAEIAQILGIPAGTAMSHVSRARAQMHKLLAEAQPQALPARGVR